MTARSRPTLMIALRELDRSARPLLRKAAQLAKIYNAGLHLVHVVGLPHGPEIAGGAAIRKAVRAETQQRTAQLDALAGSAELRGLSVSTTVSLDYPPADALVRQVLKHRPLLLLAESHRHKRLARMFLSNTDWELIRNCPCPVWLSKSAQLSARGAVLAALDPFHRHAKPAALDANILRQALAAAKGDSQRVIACHSFVIPEPVVADGVVEAYWLGMSDEERKEYAAEARGAIGKELKRYEIPVQNIVVVPGDPIAQLPRLAKKHRANVVVMGAISRQGLSRLFIGHTAERVIDQLSCDVLVVKPRGFETPVKRSPKQLAPMLSW